MGTNKTRYKRMEATITAALCLDAVIYLAYLIFSGIGQIPLKIITAILCFCISGAVLYILYKTKELLRKRSRWMTLAAACIIICLLVSLIVNFPSPRFTLP